MNVAICCLNAKYIHASLAPWCLYSSVKEKAIEGIEATVIEGTINEATTTVIERILEFKPDIISFTCYIWNIEKTLDICRLLKDKTKAIIVLGGPEVSYNSTEVLKSNDFIDYILRGEGEETYPLLIKKLKEQISVEEVPGIVYRKDKEIIEVAEKEYHNTPISPYCPEYFDNLKGRISYIETSRGCPYRCAFCLSGRCSPLRYFSMDSVKNDIIKLSNSGTRTIKFVDRTFNSKENRANEIIAFILENKGKNIPDDICFHFEIAGDILKESTMNLLSTAPKGLFQLEIGMQSFNEETLKAINRKTNTKKLKENITRLINYGNMHIHIDLIVGLTLEDFESFRNSFNTAYGLGAHMLQMGFLKLLHGADMREYPNKYPCKFNNEPPYEVTETPWISKKEIKSLKNCEDALDRLYNSGRFLKSLDYIIRECSVEPFELFFDFGNMINGCKMDLSDYALHFYDYFKDRCDADILGEMILQDLLSCSSSLQIPSIFKKKDPLYRQAKSYYTRNTSDKIKVAILRKSDKILVVDQSGEKDFRGRYPSFTVNLSEFKQ